MLGMMSELTEKKYTNGRRMCPYFPFSVDFSKQLIPFNSCEPVCSMLPLFTLITAICKAARFTALAYGLLSFLLALQSVRFHTYFQ